MQNKYLKTIKKTVIDFIEKRISSSDFLKTFNELDNNEVYESLENDGYQGLSNFVSAIQELDYINNPDTQWIVKTIDDFYAYFTNNYDYIYSKDFYKFLKFGLNKERNNPVELSFNIAVKEYLDKKITNDCLAFIANEFLNNLKYFQEEIKSNQKLRNNLNTAIRLKFNRILEDLTPEEKKLKQEIDKELKINL